jgi:2-isopropylmalate synthase
MSARERLYLFDTTLRDGAQTTGVDFSLEDKRTIAALLDRLGVDYVEGGYPGANPLDTEFFAEKRTKTAKFTAFGMTKRAGRSASNDPGVAALLDAEADAICFVAKAWDYHVHVALETTLEDNLDGIRESVAAALERGREVLVDCEHFSRRLQGQSRLRARLRPRGPRGRRALGGSVRHHGGTRPRGRPHRRARSQS